MRAPDFSLPGVDGKTHTLADYAASPLIAIVFTCNHCPTAQLHEDRINPIAADYAPKGVALIAIQPSIVSASSRTKAAWMTIDARVSSRLPMRAPRSTP